VLEIAARAVERGQFLFTDLYIGGLMDPTPLMPGAGKDLLDRFPEAERPPSAADIFSDRGLRLSRPASIPA
jgi:hypothetical protein